MNYENFTREQLVEEIQKLREKTGHEDKIIHSDGQLQPCADMEGILSRISEFLNDAVILVDEQFKIVMVNDRFTEMFGYGKPEIAGQSTELLIPVHHKVHKSRKNKYMEYPYKWATGEEGNVFAKRKDDSIFPVELNLNPLTNIQEKIIMVIIRDISHRVKADAVIFETKQELESLSEINRSVLLNKPFNEVVKKIIHTIEKICLASNVLFFIYDDRQKKLVNLGIGMGSNIQDAIEKMAGIRISELAPILKEGGRYQEILETGNSFVESDPNKIIELIKEFTDNKKLWKFIVPVIKILRLENFGAIPLVSGEDMLGLVTFNTTREYPSEKLDRLDHIGAQIALILKNYNDSIALRESERRYRSTFENAPVGILNFDKNGRLIKANKGFCEMIGYTAEELNNMTFADLTHPEDIRRSGEIRKKLWKGETIAETVEKRYIRKNGSVMWGNVKLGLQYDDKGNPVNSIVTIEDISERKNTEVSLLESNLELELLTEINSAIQKNETQKEIYAKITRAFIRICDAENIFLFRYGKLTKELVQVHFSGNRKAVNFARKMTGININEVRPLLNDNEYNTALRTGQAIIVSGIDNVAASFRHWQGFKIFRSVLKPALSMIKIKNMGIVPFTGQEGPLGMMTFATQNEISEGYLKKVDRFSKQISLILQQMMYEESLRENEAKLTEAQYIAHIGHWELDIENNFLTWSDEVYRIFGLNPREFGATLEAFADAIHPEDRQYVLDAYAVSVEKKIPYNIIHRIIRPDGEERTVHEIGKTYYDNHGKAYRSIGIVHDVTEQISAEKELKKNNDVQHALNTLLQLSVQNAPVKEINKVALTQIVSLEWLSLEKKGCIFLASDDEHLILSANVGMDDVIVNSCRRIPFGKCICGRAALTKEVQYYPDLDKNHEITYEGIKSHGHYCVPILYEDTVLGVINLYLSAGQPYSGPDVELLTTIARVLAGIINRKKIKDELIRHRDHLEDLVKERTEELHKLFLAIEQSPATVVITDREGKIEYVNPAFTKSTGYTSNEAIGQNPRILKSGIHDSEFYRGMWENLLAGNDWKDEICNKKKNGELYWESASFSPIKNNNGITTHFLAVKEDITSRKHLEKELVAAKNEADTANRAKSEFLANMSHEIRTPMNAILGFADLLEMQTENDQHLAYISSLKTSGKNLMRLINDILDLSKVEAGKLSLSYDPFSIQSLFGEMHQVFSVRLNEKGLDFQIDIDDELPDIILDETRLRQILINLVGNAVKFTEKGYIRLQGSYNTETGDLSISVEDTGIGIPDKFHEKLFSPFTQNEEHYTKTHSGTGLGLAICKRLSHLMDGDIGVVSKQGKGSIFTVSFRNVKNSGTRTEADQRPQYTTGKVIFSGATVLVADDIEDNRKYLTGLLALIGLKTMEAKDGKDALSQIAKNKPDLIITDIRMPVMNGFEFLTEIRNNSFTGNIPVIATSASAMKESINDIRSRDFNGFITKPVQRTELINELLKHLPAEIKPDMQQKEEYDFSQTKKLTIPALLAYLEKEAAPLHDQLAERQPVNVVRKFGTMMKEAGDRFGNEAFLKYGKDIIASVERFDIDKMVKLIRYYTKIIKILEQK
ncbi:MAG: PAS domain S-box protein [Bacteroidetes bacterium]|nr:PAS domain S-box protein [Bacteroidota bacterium]